MTIGIQNIRDYTGTLGVENQVLGITQVNGNPKLTWVDGSGIGSGSTSTIVEPFNISLSTIGTSSDDETGTYIHSSSFIANDTKYSSLKLYASDINVTTQDSIHIYITTLTESQDQQLKLHFEYTFPSTISNSSGYEINIILPLTFNNDLIINNKYNLGIHKNIISSEGRLHLLKNPYDNPLNGLNYLYTYDSANTNTYYIGNEVTDETTKQNNYLFFWYRLSNITNNSLPQEPYNISQSTLQDGDNNYYYIYSTFIAESTNYTKIKLYLNASSSITPDSTNKIHVRIIDSVNTEYRLGNTQITQHNLDSFITINLSSNGNTPLIVNNKYLLGIYKEIDNPYHSITNPSGNKIRLYNHSIKNPFNGLFKLTEYTSPYQFVDITNNNSQHVKLYWYKLE